MPPSTVTVQAHTTQGNSKRHGERSERLGYLKQGSADVSVKGSLRATQHLCAILFFVVVTTFKNIKTIFSSKAVQKQAMGQVGHRLLTLDLKHIFHVFIHSTKSD